MPLVEDEIPYSPGEEKYYLAFSRVEGIGPRRLARLLSYFESLGEAWKAGAGDLMSSGLEPKLVERLLAFRRSFNPDAEL
jgi:DNA processing protein